MFQIQSKYRNGSKATIEGAQKNCLNETPPSKLKLMGKKINAISDK